MAIDGPIAKNHRSVGTPLYAYQLGVLNRNRRRRNLYDQYSYNGGFCRDSLGSIYKLKDVN